MLPSVEVRERPMVGPTIDMLELEARGILTYRISRHLKALDMEPEYADGIRSGLELIYQRKL